LVELVPSCFILPQLDVVARLAFDAIQSPRIHCELLLFVKQSSSRVSSALNRFQFELNFAFGMSVVWKVIKNVSFAGFLIAMLVILVDILTFHLNATVMLTCLGIALFLAILLLVAISKWEEKKYPRERRATAIAPVNVDDQSTGQRPSLQTSSFLPTNNSNLEHPPSPVQQRIPESVEYDHPPSYEEVVQNRIQLQGSEDVRVEVVVSTTILWNS
jgi:hypothetical protein